MSSSVDCVSERVVISCTGRDRAWAEWARWHLTKAGYATELDSVDWAPGTNVVEAMNRALRPENPLLVLLSSAYLDPERSTTDEWTARLAQRRRNPAAKMIPLRVENVGLHDGLWAPIVTSDVFGLSPDHAVTVLLDAVRRVVDPAPGGSLPTAPPAYPGGPTSIGDTGPRPPGSLPAVWNLARRNPGFTGRDAMLNRLHDTLRGGSRVAVQALYGMGGVGKTQLALEYAHRFAGEYDLVWWIPAEQPELIGDHLAALAQDDQLRLVPHGTATPQSVKVLHAHLRRHGRWLLIFDNAEDREDLARWLPDGPGHLLITSRNPNWAGIAEPVDVDVFSRAESIALLRTSLPDVGDDAADRLAGSLGDLPLAVGQAMELLAETRLSIDAYLRDLADHTAELMLEGGPPAGYPLSLAATVTVAADRLSAADPAAGQLLHLCARLGPEPIPTDLFTAHPDPLPKPLQKVARKPVAFARTLAQLGRYGLARLTDDGPILHRLVQAVIRDADPRPDVTRRIVERLLVAAEPDDGVLPQWWPRWAVLLPHILALEPATADNADIRGTACAAVWHLMARGEARDARPLAEHLYQSWLGRHGPDEDSTRRITGILGSIRLELGDARRAMELDQDVLVRARRLDGTDHPRTLTAAYNLAHDLYQLGEYERARRLNEDTLNRQRRVRGQDHPDTLSTAVNLASNLFMLGDYEQARRLLEDTLPRQRRALGDDHPNTLRTTLDYSLVLFQAEEFGRSRALVEECLARCRRVLGEDHPDTLAAMARLGRAMINDGEVEQARKVDEETVARRRRVLGENHPDTLNSVMVLAWDLHEAGQTERAREMAEDALARSLRVLGKEHPHTLNVADSLATILEALDRQAEADELRKRYPPRQ
jgi:tetratricopeptide (TPR) repeat protein